MTSKYEFQSTLHRTSRDMHRHMARAYMSESGLNDVETVRGFFETFNCNSMMRKSTCARSNPAPPLLGLLVWSLSIRRSAASTRSRARSKSAMVYCRGSGRARFPRGPFDALLMRMAALSLFAVPIGLFRFSERTAPNQTYSAQFREPSRGNLGGNLGSVWS